MPARWECSCSPSSPPSRSPPSARSRFSPLSRRRSARGRTSPKRARASISASMAKRPTSGRISAARPARAVRSAAAWSSKPLPWSRRPRRFRASDARAAHRVDHRGRNRRAARGAVAGQAHGKCGARGRLSISRVVADLHAARDAGGRRLHVAHRRLCGHMGLQRQRQSVPEWWSLELDLYGGYRWTVGKVGTDLGLQYYWYPGARYNIDPGDRYNTVEVYAGVRYGHFSAKYSHALTHLFGMKTQTIGGYCGIGADGTAATTDCLGTG